MSDTAQSEQAPAEAAAAAGSEAESTFVGTTAGTVAVDDLMEALLDVVDPELGIDVVNLGLIYGVHIDESDVATIDMTLTSAACPLTDVIEDQARTATDGLVQDLKINWVWMPPWGPDKITPDGRDQLRALGFNV
ncbi:metal-sulfur cluster assembly factor [Streptacidiphilus sp. PB12-B1b]|nr:metal-sulfur cluster assembly factor [Streptacidiphilus sp. PB12-B1b]